MTFKNFDWASVLTIKSIREIIKGCNTALLETFNLNSEDVSFVYQQRLMKCDSCEIQLNGQCRNDMEGEVANSFLFGSDYRQKGEMQSGCGCLIKCKTANMDSICPLGKWLRFQVNNTEKAINVEINEI